MDCWTIYGPTFYPPGKTTADERFAWGKEHFEKEVGLEKFRLFFAVHEFEAWLLSHARHFLTGDQETLCQPRSEAARKGQLWVEPPAKLLDPESPSSRQDTAL